MFSFKTLDVIICIMYFLWQVGMKQYCWNYPMGVILGWLDPPRYPWAAQSHDDWDMFLCIWFLHVKKSQGSFCILLGLVHQWDGISSSLKILPEHLGLRARYCSQTSMIVKTCAAFSSVYSCQWSIVVMLILENCSFESDMFIIITAIILWCCSLDKP